MNVRPLLVGTAAAFGLVAALASADVTRRAGDAGRAFAIFPMQRMPLRFDHQLHVQDLHVKCVRCHVGARTSTSSADSLIPPESACTGCHLIDRNNPEADTIPPSRCDTCHVGFRPGTPVARVRVPPPNLRFPHKTHVDRGIECTTCHADVPTKSLATRADLPEMRTCLSCHHDGGDAPAACATCHLTLPDGRMRASFEEGVLTPPSWMRGAEHGPGWVLRHKFVAGNDSPFCANCHAESECVDCHDGRVRPRDVHPGDWITTHPVSARRNDPDCASCHREQTFCIACHRRAGVAPDLGTRRAARATGRFHPPPDVWSSVAGRNPMHHRFEAQRNLATCVSCHTEDDCVACHGALGVGGARTSGIAPHPGFQVTGIVRDCKRLLRANPRPCLRCHVGTATDLADHSACE